MMQLPQFKYSPNAYRLDLFVAEEGLCSVCAEPRQLKYASSFYSVEEPEYLCPWCIANGAAAAKYDGEFNDYCGAEGSGEGGQSTVPPALILQVTTRTPGYFSWQQEVWLSHCHEPCAFIGYADGEIVQSLMPELSEDIVQHGYDADFIKTHLSVDGSLAGYLFQCVHCGKHRLHMDCD